jgi:hypothetical protein
MKLRKRRRWRSFSKGFFNRLLRFYDKNFNGSDPSIGLAEPKTPELESGLLQGRSLHVLLISGGAFMAQEESQEIKELRSEMRKGRLPLIEVIRSAYKPYLIAMKGWERKNAELREQVGLLSSDFSEKGRVLRSSARSAQEGGLGVVESYKELAKQAKAVASLIDKELPNLVKLYEPVGELHATYQQALANYEACMASWRGRLPASDLSGRALELALTEIERSLR